MILEVKRHRGAVALALMALVTASAGHAGARERKPEKTQPEAPKLMWPEPPLAPRIKFVRLLQSELDLGKGPTKGDSFMTFLTGQRKAYTRLAQPRDLAVSDDGNRVYVSDFGQMQVFVFDLQHSEMRALGNGRRFARPFGVALDAAENVYVVEQETRTIQVLDRQGSPLRTITHASLVRPTDAVVDRVRNQLIVADPSTKDSEDHTVKVFDLEGKLIRKIGDGKGTCEGCLYFPTFVTVDESGTTYISNTLNSRVDIFDAEGKYRGKIGERGTSFGMFDKPKGVALDTFGNIYVVDSGWSNVQIFNQKGQVLLFFGGRGNYPGLLKNPTGIVIDRNNKIYVGDYLNYRIVVYELVNTKAADSYQSSDAEPMKGGNTPQNDEPQSKQNSEGSQADITRRLRQ